MAKERKRKIFVLDTNVLLHDYRAIYAFQENDIVIPITVLEEVDKFKKGHDQINYNAREIVRELDKLAGDALFDKGISLGKGRGKLFIETGRAFSDKMNLSFGEMIPDHRILSITENVQEDNTECKVALVSKDINLRMKAKSLGLNAEDYQNDKVESIDKLEEGIKVEDQIEDVLIAKLYEDKKGVSIDEFKFRKPPVANEYSILKSDRSSVISYYDPREKLIKRVSKRRMYGIEPRNAEQTFAMHALTNKDVQLIAITGKAGTGKTLLALAAALSQEKEFSQILLARPIVALANKDMGFLPGSDKDKIRPYMQPLFDNLTVIKQALHGHGDEVSKIEQMLKDERLMISPLAYIRGRSLANVYFIIDEAQNLTPHEVKTIITRAGEGTKIVFTGDVQQIDSPYLDTMSNGLTHLTDKMDGQEIFTHINLVKGERSKLAELASNIL
jgi:PhoH-like ATPase